MARFRKKPVVIEAITFEELVAAGVATGAPLTNEMPWSFEYAGHAITHENDDCYLIPTLEGTMRFERGDMLITGVKGEIYPCKRDIFLSTYGEAGHNAESDPSKYFVTSGEVVHEVVADEWSMRDGILTLRREGRVVSMFTYWQGFTAE